MTMDPGTLRNRSVFPATRFLLLSSVHHGRDVRLKVAVTRHCHDPETFIVAPGFSQRFAMCCTRNIFQPRPVLSQWCGVFQQKKILVIHLR